MRRPHLVAQLVAHAAGEQEEEDGEREEEHLQAAVDAQRLDEEDEGQDAPACNQCKAIMSPLRLCNANQKLALGCLRSACQMGPTCMYACWLAGQSDAALY